jgi:hypothetical protein
MSTARWARRDRYRSEHGCRYCGRFGADCAIAVCDACGSPQCHGNGLGRGQCSICYVGLLPGWSGHDRPCSRKGCRQRAVAEAPRAGNVCAEHALIAVCVAAGKGRERQTVAEYVQRRLEERAKQWELIDLGAVRAA